MMMPKEITELLLELEGKHGAGNVREGCRKYMLRRTFAGELPESRKKISRRAKEKLYFAQKQECNICHQPFKLNELKVDEFIPASRGGKRIHGNIQLLCEECNAAKTNHTPSEEAKRTGVGITEQIMRLPQVDGEHNEDT